MKGSHLLTALAAGLMLACGGGNTSSSGGSQSNRLPGTAYRSTTTLVTHGVVAALPAGTVFISVSDLTAPPGAVIQAPNTAGVLYVVSGTASVSGAAPEQLKAGEAAFLSPGPAQLANSGATASQWYFMAVQAAADRAAPPPLAGATRIFATDDLPPLPQINQAEALQQTKLQAGGRSDSYRPNGVEALIGAGGAPEVQANDLTEHLGPGTAAFVLEGTVVQVLNAGSASAVVLSFFLLPDGSPLTRSSK